jgi:pyroglutamyl-peptidase
MVKAMREAGIPSDISDTPGTFCCNHLMYGILHHISSNGLPIRAGWIHLPHLPVVAALPENLGAPSMSAETSATGVEVALRAVLENTQDIDEPILSRLQI